jgi:primary-amine oxidase
MSFAQEVKSNALRQSIEVNHPLDPLTPAELTLTVQIVRSQPHFSVTMRFVTVMLKEPVKSVVQAFQAGDLIQRQAFVILLDNALGQTYEVTVDLVSEKPIAWQHIPGVQPRIMADEMAECEAAVKADRQFQAILAQRRIAVEQVVLDTWAIGNFGLAEEQGLRLARALCWLRPQPNANFYARPIEGIVPLVNLNTMQVVKIDDLGAVPIPLDPGNYAAEFIPQFRQDIQPLEIQQPQGASFTVTGNLVEWQKWRFRVGFNPREGLVISTVGFQDQGRWRSILYRASLAEMVVPYGDPRPQHFRKNAFDVGEHGVGMLANSLRLGCDCLGEIHYFDAYLTDSRGEVIEITNAVCLHEEDFGVLWKHSDWRIDQVEVRRSRRLVISFFTTVDNYEYGFFWYFYQDGTLQYEVKLTGILLTAAVAPGETVKYGKLVAPQLNAIVHQHFFNLRLDFDIDGQNNSIYEVNTVAEPLGPENPYGNAFYAQSTLLPSEQTAQRLVEPLTARSWLVVNPAVQNSLGEPVGYKLLPGENVLPFAHPDSSLLKRAGFMTKHLWVTPYDQQENYPAGNYPNQNPGGEGLPAWTKGDRPLENQDLVVWYTFGHHHIPRPEEWPVMPVAYAGFSLKPCGFFDRNPSLDVPPSDQHGCCESSS